MPATLYANKTHWEAAEPQTARRSRGAVWAGRTLRGLPGLFLAGDGAMKLFKPAPVLEGTLQLGFPESCIIGLGSSC
jgi:hypothetical protein